MKVKIPKALTVKAAGLPRWVWLGGIVVMIGLYVYIQYRNSQDEVGLTEDEGQPEIEPYAEGDLMPGGDVFPTNTGSVAFLPGGGGAPGPMGPPAVTSDPTNIIVNAPIDNRGHYTKQCKDGRPTKQAPKGFHWQCINGKWVAVGNVKKPTSKPNPNRKCGKRPKKNAGKGYHWECRQSKWVRTKNKSQRLKGMFFDGPLISMSDPTTRRDIHRIDRSPIFRSVKELNG